MSLIGIADDTGLGWVAERLPRVEIVPGGVVLAAICPHPLVVASVHEAAKSKPRLLPQRVCESEKDDIDLSIKSWESKDFEISLPGTSNHFHNSALCPRIYYDKLFTGSLGNRSMW